VLLEIRVRPERTTKVTLRAKHGGHVGVKAHAHRTLHRYVVIPVGSSKRFSVRIHHGRARVTVRFVSRYR
jgi:hypothetical protein